jgi:nitroimidazol reductase NimA-like FMN-containing flavoprotein (pyridoxamine 5'-phosphate oxidase superfamily)
MDLEDVSDFKLSEELALQLLNEQRECTFAWSTRSGTPAAATMSYVHRDGALWLATVEGRKRLRAIRERPSVSVVISSVGTSMGPG